MSTFKLNSKVVFVKDGKDLVGLIGIVGHSVMGVYVDNACHVVKTKDLEHVTPARIAGFKVGDKARVVCDSVGFTKGQIVTLHTDDGTDRPLWEGENTHYQNVHDPIRGRQPGAFLSLALAEKVPTGPKKGVLWTDAPNGATHYSLADDHAEKWHKLEGGEWFFYVDYASTWQWYFDEDFACVTTQVEIPISKPVAALPVVKAPEKWEKGDVIEALNDESFDITEGSFYILTSDRSGDTIQFRDDSGHPRHRTTENFRLIVKRNK